ncbi:hypothetical protein ACFW6V_14235 [Streptomyces sp. NPDC058734]|uniref:hypothetical protein n=1 Tax=Streptomyces sp. NPDC058734 TaxID=3346615 RepID=UPI00368A047C
MSRPRAWVGDQVLDAHGYNAVVTDVRAGGSVWVLRPAHGGTTHVWETSDPSTLIVIRTRTERSTRS